MKLFNIIPVYVNRGFLFTYTGDITMEFTWFICGLLTAWLMYHDKEKIPVVKSIFVVFFGLLSLVVWILFHLGYAINNPMYKQNVTTGKSK
jgi:hypothetical protein